MNHVFGRIVAFARRIVEFEFLILSLQLCITSDASGVKRIHKDLGPLALPPSAFSSSSVYKNLPEHQAHKANLNVFASQEQSSGAWCPGSPIQNQLSEWLQISFDSLKIMRIIFTEGRGHNQNAYVPAFLLRYQRQDDHRWYDYRMRNGTKLLYANHNGQTIAITLDPPIVAKRFRLYPYNELEPRFMCLRLAVYGSPFDDGVIEYAIPEGGVYRLDPRFHASLNDTSYDGWWTQSSVSTSTGDHSSPGDFRRAYFHGGLGLLMDKQYYDGQLPDPESVHNVVGWFRRQYSPPSDRVTMLFTFDKVRNFSSVRIHTLNTLNYVAVFRRVLVQFSRGGQYYDRGSTPVLMHIPRDLTNREARWISIELGHRIARFIRIVLWFDYDWIVLSEVVFDSVAVASDVPLREEKQSDPIFKLPDLEMPEPEHEPFWGMVTSTAVSSPEKDFNRLPEPSAHHTTNSMIEVAAVRETLAESSSISTGKLRMASAPYLVAIVCCCLGSIAFASMFVYLVYRLRRQRRKRLKKLQKGQSLENAKHPNQFLLTNPHQNGGFFQPPTSGPFVAATSNSTLLVPDGHTMSSIQPQLLQYNALKTATPTSFGHPNALKGFERGTQRLTAPMLSAHNAGTVSVQQTIPDSIVATGYNSFAPTIDQDGLFALQLLHHGSTPGSNFSSLGGLTLARRGTSDASAFSPYPLASVSQAGLINLALSTSNAGVIDPTTLPFSPPPPPDQPLPPLPPPSNSPDSLQHPVFGDRLTSRFLVGAQLSSVTPYGPSFPVHSFTTDTGLLLPIDGSMPEYASASLFSGNGSVQPSPGPLPPTSSINSKGSTSDPETTRPRMVGETYCVPHQNSPHVPFGFWPSNINKYSSNKTALVNSVPQPPLSTVLGTNSSCHTGSLDSSGMYYLANPSDSIQLDMHNAPIQDHNFQSRALFFPFSSATPLFPVHGMTLLSEHKTGITDAMHTQAPNISDPASSTHVDNMITPRLFLHNHPAIGVKNKNNDGLLSDPSSIEVPSKLPALSNICPSKDSGIMT